MIGTPGPLPEWVYLRARAPETDVEPQAHWIAETLANPPACKPGGQEGTLSRLCWWAARNLEPDIASAILGRWLAALPLGNPHDPWTADHLAEKLDRAFEKRPADPGNAGPIVGDTPIPTGMFEVVADLSFPEQQWVVADFAAPGCFTELIGKVKKGKSTLAYQLIAAVCAGAPFIGRETVQGGVVLLTEQTGTSLKKTLERAQLLGSRDVHVLRKPAILALGGWGKAVRAATALCRETGIRLIVVDTLSRLASIGGDSENSSGAVSVLDPFMDARELGVACVFVRHARKGQSGIQDEIADAARGSSAITGDMDIVLRLATAEGNLRCLSWESRITDDPEDVYLEYHEGTYEVIDRPEGKREQAEREEVKALRAAIEEHGAKRNVLAKALGWGNAKTDRLLKKLHHHGPMAKPPEDA